MSPIYLTELQQHSLLLTSLQYHLLVYCSQYHICSTLIHQYIRSLVHSSKHELYLQSQLLFLLKLNQLDSASLEYTSSDPFSVFLDKLHPICYESFKLHGFILDVSQRHLTVCPKYLSQHSKIILSLTALQLLQKAQLQLIPFLAWKQTS